jgi:hypothetical protein
MLCAKKRSGKKPRQKAENPVTVPKLGTTGTAEVALRHFARRWYNPEPFQYCKFSAILEQITPALECSSYAQAGGLSSTLFPVGIACRAKFFHGFP